MRRTSSSASPIGSSTRTRRFGRRAALLARNERGASGLWARGISGDLPIVVVRIDEAEDLDIVRQLLRAHEYWRLKLLTVDLVIVNEQGASYAQDLQEALETLVRTSQSALAHEGHAARGGVHILRGDLLPAEDRTLLQTAARAVLLSRRGSLAEQVIRLERPDRIVLSAPSVPERPERRRPPVGRPSAGSSRPEAAGSPRPRAGVLQRPGWLRRRRAGVRHRPGAGTGDAGALAQRHRQPSFGFQVSESGSGYTWAENSRENQLTPWSNDPVGDPVGEAIYVRDDDSGELWGPTALPIRSAESTYVARHGPGYSRFEHERDGIGLGLVQFVPLDATG